MKNNIKKTGEEKPPLNQSVNWGEIDSTGDKLKHIVRLLVSTDLGEKETVEKLFLLFGVLASFEDGDKSATALLAGELQQYVFTFSEPCVEAFYELDKNIVEGFLGEEAKKQPLDLSGSSVEDLSIKLSEIMQNPNLPEGMYGCIADEINKQTGKDTDLDNPEIIKSALQKSLNETK